VKDVMTRDELEFSISQYVDGTLVDDRQRSALEERLATDAEARVLYAEYQSLQGVLATSLPAMPEVDWDQFAARVSAAVDREQMPAQSYKISRWFSQPMKFAMAASVFIAGAIAFTLMRPGASNTGTLPATNAPTQIVRVDSPVPAAGTSPEVAANASTEPTLVVAIVPPAADDGRPTVLYADSVVQRPSRAMIVSAAPVGQDTSAAPF
jgi:negative regulator of sigma E activity